MKIKLALCLSIIVSSLYGQDCGSTSGSTCPLTYIKNIKNIKCPESMVKENTQSINSNQNKNIESITEIGEIKEIYIDVLKSLHGKEDVSLFISEKSFKDFIQTDLFNRLLTERAMKNKTNYDDILMTVDANNPHWCQVLKDERFSNE